MFRRAGVVVGGVLLVTSLVVMAGVAAGHGSISVGFGTDRVTIDSGDRGEVVVVVDSAIDGVDTVDLSISTDAAEVVAITGASVPDGTANVTVSPNGTRVDVSASGLDRDGPAADVLILSLAARSNGSATLAVESASVLPPAGAPYLTTQRGTVSVVVGQSSTDDAAPALLLVGVVVASLLALGAYAAVRRR